MTKLMPLYSHKEGTKVKLSNSGKNLIMTCQIITCEVLFTSSKVLWKCFLQLRVDDQYVLPKPNSYLSTTACGVYLVYWILWLMLGMLVLVGFESCSYLRRTLFPGISEMI